MYGCAPIKGTRFNFLLKLDEARISDGNLSNKKTLKLKVQEIKKNIYSDNTKKKNCGKKKVNAI